MTGTLNDVIPSKPRFLDNVPRFIILGVMKCGTTALYDYVCQHPNVLSARRKETHFFDWRWSEAIRHRLMPPEIALADAAMEFDATYSDNTIYSKGTIPKKNTLDLRRVYLQLFPVTKMIEAAPQRILVSGEATPSYLLYGESLASKILTLTPNVRLVIVVRDPVDRVYSHYNMTIDPEGNDVVKRMRGSFKILNSEGFPKTMEELVEKDLEELAQAGLNDEKLVDDKVISSLGTNYFNKRPNNGHGAHSWVGRGLYYAQIKLWLRHFSRDQLLIVNSDDLRTSESCQNELNKVFRHIGVSPHVISDTAPKNTAEQRGRKAWQKPFNPKLKQKLRDFFRPHNEAFFDLVGVDYGWNHK
eukprot:GSMAST32.ASY1.ANO1.1220.1 assembled CDS